MKVTFLIGMITCIASAAFAHISYTGGYSGAPGTRTCAASCHGGTGGSLVVTGFPTAYQPGQSYRVVVKHTSGSPIVNFNVTTRVGSTNTVGGTFAAATNSTLYTGTDGGVYASPHLIDSAVFLWTAPSSGTGPITFYAAAFQGTTTSSNGQSRSLSIASTEIVTAVDNQVPLPARFQLEQNYPNPFNPGTSITFRLSDGQSGSVGVTAAGFLVNLSIYDVLGRRVETFVEAALPPGVYTIRWDASSYSAGVYFCCLRAGDFITTRRMTLLK
jgi:hypothetical protein